ncbi:EAL domain-containing protein [Paucibacter sp. R3-3]|uniref:EAL domain-containing protein n=1 Tax=Roseateles agri TaxID=3098619 RepID=A0ABU5DLG6_9BURK|nr:EAL domain-containing protein [Paucibacter sp. R3-3]MDY0747143.1 EAL domain-containing protein [Paucibacter sp. R3-3]
MQHTARSPVLLLTLALGAAALWLGAGAADPLQGWRPAGHGSLIALPLALCLVPLLAWALFALRRDLRQQQDLLDSADIGVALWQRVRTGPMGKAKASPTWQRMTGQSTQEASTPSAWLDAAAHPLDCEAARGAIHALLLAGSPQDEYRGTLRLRTEAGWRRCELHARVLRRNRQGQASQLVSRLSDVTLQYTAAERERISAGLFQHLQEGVMVTDLELRALDANPACCRMLGVTREALLGRLAAPLRPESVKQAGHDLSQLHAVLRAGDDWRGCVSTTRADGSTCVLQLSISTIPEPDGPTRFHVVTLVDLTRQLRQQQQLDRESRFDPLTGLPNHGEFIRMLRAAMSAPEPMRLAVCRVDLDRFKQVNAQRGSAAADALLIQAAKRLEAALRGAQGGRRWADAVARLDGDEFALMLRVHDADEAQRAVARLLNVLRAPYPLESLESGRHEAAAEITASIGATLYPQDDADAETLLRHAGHALYRAKHAGRNGYRFFDTAKRLRDEASLIELARIQQALDDEELRLHFQPKIDMQSGRVLGMEALLRWQHPERGLLAPGEFLPLVEHTGLAVQIGDWVIEQALKQVALWLEQGLGLEVSVNVTARQLQTPDFAQRLQELIARHQRPVAPYLSLEVLESAALADVQAAHELIQRCRTFGVRFALDDFGTGYSTLTYLKKLPVDALKIDRSFVQHMLTDAQDMALVEGVIGLARHFGAEVIAEGVESAAHARALLRLGCQLGQGNGIAAAMPAADVPGWVEAFSRSPWLDSTNPGPRRQALN